MSPRVVAIFGVSGVGKSRLARRYSEQRSDTLHVEASALLRNWSGQTSEELRTADSSVFEDNQRRLTEEFERIRRTCLASLILFDGHTVIDGREGYLDVSTEFIISIAPSLLIFVEDRPAAILVRRETDQRPRPTRTAEQIHEYQERARAAAERFSIACGAPFETLESGDLSGFSRTIKSVLES